jgi:type IV secretion system protein VirD4
MRADGEILLGKLGSEHLMLGGNQHAALYAPTRSGKGISCVVPNALTWPYSTVILDMKRETWRASSGWRAHALGQPTYLFDPLSPDGRTHRFNPLSSVDRTAPDRFDQIQRIGQAVFPNSAGNAKFWDDAARQAFNSVACFVAETPAIPLNMAQVMRLFTASWASDYLRKMIAEARKEEHPYSLAVVDGISDYLGNGSSERAQKLSDEIRKSVSTRLALWLNPRIAAATEVSDFNIGRLRYEPFSIYVAVNPGDIERLQPLLALFFQSLIQTNTRMHPDEDPDYRHPVLVILDEFASLGRLSVLAASFAFIAGYGVRFLLVCQSPSQLRDPDLYGPDMAATILDNTGVELCFGTKNVGLAEELSRRVGFNTVDSVTRNRPRFWGAWQWRKQSVAAHPHSRAQLLPQEILRMRADQELVFRAGMTPILANRLRWYDDPVLSQRAMSPPEVPAIEITTPLDDGEMTVAPPFVRPAGGVVETLKTPFIPTPSGQAARRAAVKDAEGRRGVGLILDGREHAATPNGVMK